jgi:hypothetical protein
MACSALEGLILDLLRWLSERQRSYEEVLDAWRTSCPKLPVWEEANDRGLVASRIISGARVVGVTPAGFALIAEHDSRAVLHR